MEEFLKIQFKKMLGGVKKVKIKKAWNLQIINLYKL